MNHIFKKGSVEDTLILLHGTGGNEFDLLDIGETVFFEANKLGIRGNVIENGMPRFFERYKEGGFNLESYETQTINLKNAINDLIEKYNLNKEKIWILGYSNGANIAVNLLANNPDTFKGLALLHAMPIKQNLKIPNQKTKVLLTAGINDPIIPFEQTKQLESQLKEKTENFEMKVYTYGHSLSNQEIYDVKDWFDKYK